MALAACIFCPWDFARADDEVSTQHNDLSRTGADLKEGTLKVKNVNTNEFGLLFTRAVDDQIYAQPLIAAKVRVPNQKKSHNLVIVATVNDSVYAFDADDAAVSAPYWQVSFLNANAVPPVNTDMALCGSSYNDFSGNIGIVSTPVIDPKKKILYVLARTKEFGSVFVQKLHALDLRTGAEMPDSPVTIAATYPGNGDGSVNGVLTFDPQRQNQRSALALVKDVVYIGWASHGDCGPYHGWLMGYDAATLQQVVVYNTTPEGGDGGIWMAGEGLAADTSGNLYVSIGNGTVGNTDGNPRDPVNRGESFLKLTRSGGSLIVTNWFTPFDYQNLEDNDLDLGSAGLLLIPNTTLVFSGGKEGVFYLTDRNKMGGLSYSGADTNVLQSFQVDNNSHKIFSSPVWWDGSKASYAYVWVSDSDYLRQYQFDKKAGKFLLPQFAASTDPAPDGMPGGILSISADGRKSGSAIVWASHQLGGSANQTTRAGILHAYNAENVSQELWNSEQNSARDSVGLFAKFVPPTIANGKVYLATFSDRLNVYGLLPKQ